MRLEKSQRWISLSFAFLVRALFWRAGSERAVVAEIRGQQRHRAMGYVAHSSVFGVFFWFCYAFRVLEAKYFLELQWNSPHCSWWRPEAASTRSRMRSPSDEATAFTQGDVFFLPSVPSAGACILPSTTVAFPIGSLSVWAVWKEHKPVSLILGTLMFYHLFWGALWFVTLLCMIDPFKEVFIKSLLSGEGKWEIPDNWKGEVKKQILNVIWTSSQSLKFKWEKIWFFFSVPSCNQCIMEESTWCMTFSSDFSWEGPLGFEAK